MRSSFSTKHPSGKEEEVEAVVQQDFFLFMLPGLITFIPHLNGIFLFMGKGKNDKMIP